MTSSQAHTAFTTALPAYVEDPSWIAVALYLYGPEWRVVLNVPTQDNEEEGSAQNDSIANYLQAFEFEDGNDAQMDAHSFLVSFVCSQDDEYLSEGSSDDEDLSEGSSNDDDSNNDNVDRESVDHGNEFDTLHWASQQGGDEQEVLNEGKNPFA